jgi:hypothetical protein
MIAEKIQAFSALFSGDWQDLRIKGSGIVHFSFNGEGNRL